MYIVLVARGICITGHPTAVQRATRLTTVVLVTLTAADTRRTTCRLGIYVIVRTRIARRITRAEQIYTSLTGSGVTIAAAYRILLRVALVAGIGITFYPTAVN